MFIPQISKRKRVEMGVERNGHVNKRQKLANVSEQKKVQTTISPPGGADNVVIVMAELSPKNFYSAKTVRRSTRLVREEIDASLRTSTPPPRRSNKPKKDKKPVLGKEDSKDVVHKTVQQKEKPRGVKLSTDVPKQEPLVESGDLARAYEEGDSPLAPEPSPRHADEPVLTQSDNEEEDYEEKRLQNIKDNANFLAQIGIMETKQLWSEKKKVKPVSRGLKERKEKEVLPRRSSMRIRRIDPEGNHLPPPPPAKESLDEAYYPRRRSSGPLDMMDELTNVEDAKDRLELRQQLGKLALATPTPPAASNSPLTSLLKGLRKLRLSADHVAKVVPQRVTAVVLHPSQTRVLACAGDKRGRLGMWHVESQAGPQDGVFNFAPHTRAVTHLSCRPDGPDKLFSSSGDGTLRCAMLETAVFDEVYATPDGDDIGLSGFDWLSDVTMVVSQSDGCVAVVDPRTPGADAELLYRVHDRQVKCVSVHPVTRQHLATASSDGTVCLWDLRRMKGQLYPLDSLPHSKSVDSAYFSPLTGNLLLTTALDNNIRIYDSSNPGGDLKLKRAIRHDNHTGRWLSNFRATWHPATEDLFVVGSMVRPRRVELFSSDGELVHTLSDGDNLASVCSLNAFHPTRNIVAGANSSGKLHVFM